MFWFWLVEPEWMRMCARKSLCCANDRLHVVHTYGRSPVCVRWWICRRKTLENARPQSLQACGFSPVCTRMWTFKLLLSTNPRSQIWHLYGLTPLCLLVCKSNAPRVLNVFVQTLQLNGRSLVCVCREKREWKKLKYFRSFGRCVNAGWLTRTCACRSDWAQNDLLQYSHECSFLLPFFRLCLALLSSTSFTLDGCSLTKERFAIYFTSFLSWWWRQQRTMNRKYFRRMEYLRKNQFGVLVRLHVFQ